MKLLANSTPRAACSRPVAVRNVARPFSVASLSSRRQQRLVYVRAEEASTATTEVADAATDNSEAQQASANPLEKARQALQSDDKATLEAALAELDQEIARLNDVAAAAESRAGVLENTVSTAKDQLLRLNADFDNYRRRSQTEKEALADSVRSDVVQQLLPLVDNFELARTQVKVETEGENRINTSYQGLYKQMVDIMRGLGIEAVPTTGSPFDPEIHEAIMREADDTVPDGTVLQEFRKGFRLGDKLIRPAMVKVSMNESGATPSEQ